MAYFLAVDAGGTKAEFLLADDDRELTRVLSGSIYRLNVSSDEARRNLDWALGEITAKTGVSLSHVARTCVGTAGNSVPLVVDWLRENFASRVSGDLHIVGDVEIALEAAFPSDRGILILAGTGSNVAGRGSDRRIVTAGGWGPVLANQGSGHWIGMEALRRGFLAIDERRPTHLLEMARNVWGLPSVEALIEVGNAEPRPRFAELTPMVAECAAEGDVIAASILDQAGTDLGYLAQLVIERIRSEETEKLPLPAIATAGSVVGKIERVRDALIASLRSRYPEIRFVLEPTDPVLGALHYARTMDDK